MEVRIRLGTALARFAPTPSLSLELTDGATVQDLLTRLAATQPDLAPALRSALPVRHGAPIERDQSLAHGDEIALLTPVAGG